MFAGYGRFGGFLFAGVFGIMMVLVYREDDVNFRDLCGHIPPLSHLQCDISPKEIPPLGQMSRSDKRGAASTKRRMSWIC